MISIYVKSKPRTGQTKWVQKEFFFLNLQTTSPIWKLCLKNLCVNHVTSDSILPFVKSMPNPLHPGYTLSGPALLCSRITHFHSCGSPLSLLSNQVNLFIFIFHVFFCYIIHPSWTSCRKQQCLGVVLRTWKERPLISVITTHSDTWELMKKQQICSQIEVYVCSKSATRRKLRSN